MSNEHEVKCADAVNQDGTQMQDGVVYLLHFEPPYKHARHYVGWSVHEAEHRLKTHLAGQGSPLVKAAVAAGCKIILARTWKGTRAWERKVKDTKNVPHLCPICNPPKEGQDGEVSRV